MCRRSDNSKIVPLTYRRRGSGLEKKMKRIKKDDLLLTCHEKHRLGKLCEKGTTGIYKTLDSVSACAVRTG